MSFLDHIHHANNADLDAYLPYFCQDRQIGWIGQGKLEQLAPWPDLFRIAGGRVRMALERDDYAGRSRALAEATAILRDRGLIEGWREEPYPVTDDFNRPPLAEIERAACPYLGMRSWGVHMTGYVNRPDGLHIWVARRADDKPNYPGMLDNTVAGGQPLGLSPRENMIKECAEEAGISGPMAEKLKPVGLISYIHQSEAGLKPDQMFCYELELPDGFIPANTDGEVAAFNLVPAEEVLETVRDTALFKYNCNLCLIDFFIRHGLITPENETDYARLCMGLRGHLPQ